MTIEVRVPVLGESVAEATVGKWYKAVGDAVAIDEVTVSYTHLTLPTICSV